MVGSNNSSVEKVHNMLIEKIILTFFYSCDTIYARDVKNT
jgi:hypothetical protein